MRTAQEVAVRSRAVRSVGGSAGVFLRRMRALWGVLLIFYELIFSNTQFHWCRHADCHQLSQSTAGLPCTPAPP